MDETRKSGRVTIPTDLDVVPETLEILKKWGVNEFLIVFSAILTNSL